MGSFSLWHWLVVLVVVLLLFGRGRVSEIMGDFGKGIKSFKQGLADEDKSANSPPPQIPSADASPTQPSADTADTTKTGQ